MVGRRTAGQLHAQALLGRLQPGGGTGDRRLGAHLIGHRAAGAHDGPSLARRVQTGLGALDVAARGLDLVGGRIAQGFSPDADLPQVRAGRFHGRIDALAILGRPTAQQLLQALLAAPYGGAARVHRAAGACQLGGGGPLLHLRQLG
jgi:hypothetical protein